MFLSLVFIFINFSIWGQSLRDLKGHPIQLPAHKVQNKVIYIQSQCLDCLAWLDSLEPCFKQISTEWTLITLDKWSIAKDTYNNKFYHDWVLVTDSQKIKQTIPGTPTLMINNSLLHTKLNCQQLITQKENSREKSY